MRGWRAEVNGIRRDNRSGARELAVRAVQVLEAFVQKEEARTRETWQQRLRDIGFALIAAQPAMAPMLTLVNGAFLGAEARDIREARKTLRGFLRRYRRALTQEVLLITRHLSPLLAEGATLLSHSWSSTVFDVLREAYRLGKRFRVICPEARPGLEGLRMARELGRVGIEVEVIVDALAPWWVKHSHLVVVGADSISFQGLLNKAGTFALALGARAYRIPFYAVAGTEKFVPGPLHRYLQIAERPPHEVLPKKMAGIRAVNWYFDVTPLRHLSGVVTEQGLLSPPQVRALLRGLPVSRLFASLPVDRRW